MAEKKAMETALSFLSRRAYTKQRLADRLSGAGLDPADINETLNRLRDWGYLDDNEYGVNRITTLQARLKSRAFVEGDLLVNGLKPELVHELMNIYYPEELEIEIAKRLLRKRPHKGRKNKNWGPAFLTRSGFSENTIHRCFSEVSST